jgi:hypothetical protein
MIDYMSSMLFRSFNFIYKSYSPELSSKKKKKYTNNNQHDVSYTKKNAKKHNENRCIE